MVASRIVVVSRDAAIGHELATALAAMNAAVEVQTTDSVDLGQLPPSLCVVHFAAELAPDDRARVLRSIGDCPMIAVSPRASLATVVELLQSSNRVAGVVVSEQLDPSRLCAMASRIVKDDVFGLDKLLGPETQIHALEVGDYRDKLQCMSRVSAFVEQCGVPRKYHAPIEQCLDEMLMNALYDAPVDAQGAHIFSGIPITTRVTMRSEQSVVVQYAYDGKHFGMSVRDAFGSLERHTVVRFLDKCLHADEKIDRRAGGAGVGLYLMVNSSNVVHYNVLPGIATEAVCIFDVDAPSGQLEQFGFLVQKDPAGRIATGPSRRVRVWTRRSRIIMAATLAAIAALAVLAVVAWPRLFGETEMVRVTFTTNPKGATIEIDGRTAGVATNGTLSTDLEVGRAHTLIARLDGYEPAHATVTPSEGTTAVTFDLQAFAVVELESDPTDAAVDIDGKPMGSTPLRLTSLAPRSKVAVVFERRGYRSATAQLEVPERGEVTSHVQKLEPSEDFVRVRFVSNPAGAEIIVSGQPATVDRTYTPAELFLEVDKVQRVTLTMPRHAPLVIEPFTPRRGEQGLEKGGGLVALPSQP